MSSSITEKDTRGLVAGSNGMILVIVLVLLVGAVAGFAYWASIPAGNVFTGAFSVPLDGATTAKVDINTAAGNLTIDRLATTEQVLAGGTLQYLESQGIPIRSVNASNGQATLTVREQDAGQPGFRLPWAACNVATEWHVQLNPNVQSDITAHSGGGNVKLDLAGMAVTRITADTGGGNMDVVLPDGASGLNVKASTGAGNVTVGVGSGVSGSNTVDARSGAGDVVVHVPSGVAARIHATSGVGKVTLDPRFSKIEGNTYQSSDYESAADRVEIAVNSGAGNVSVDTK